MNKIKISHETPKCLLKQSITFSNYQYSLPHLLESDEDYKNHFINCSNQGVEIYLDNSIHELGKAMDDDVLLKWISILKPSHFFIPDWWANSQESIQNAKRWSTINTNQTTKIAVIQATDIYDAIECYTEYKALGYTKFAFSYAATYYREFHYHPNEYLGKALGRLFVINTMINSGVISDNDKIHLLGTGYPAEFQW